MSKYQYTDDMAEISGFGGGYESTCRAMVAAGLEWFDGHPKAVPDVLNPDYPLNDDARELCHALVGAAGGACTRDMHRLAFTHVMHVRRIGWDAYCAEMRGKRPRGDAENAEEVPS